MFASTEPGPGGDPRPDRSGPLQLSETGQRVFECLPLGLVVFDHQLVILHGNPAAELVVRGHTSITEALAAGTVDARYEDWGKAFRDVIDHGRQRRFEQVIYRDDQHREILLDLLCIAITNATGHEVTGGILVIEDVTANVSMEKRLAVSERMAAVGKLAARVAHELNNPLDGILRYLNLGLRAMGTGKTDKVGEYLKEARDGLLRMAEIVRELVEFSRSGHTPFDDTGINAVVEEAVKVMYDKAAQNNVSIICTLHNEMPAVRGANLFQVFCNLIKNALDAMPNGGRLTIATQVVDTEAVIRFEDNGIGLPDNMERMFEPFFTTKDATKGTGLGLAICKDIIEKYNGKITPMQRPEGGAIFTIQIPLDSCVTLRAARPGTTPTATQAQWTSARPQENSR